MEFLAHSILLSPGSIEQACLLAGMTGVLSHVLYFARGYRVPQTVQILGAHLLLAGLLLARAVLDKGWLAGLAASALIILSYLTSLYSSIVIYRIFFHRLRSFPGPVLAGASKLYSLLLAQDGKIHLRQTEWAKKYGDVVRIGPNELMFVSIDAMQKVHGNKANASKQQTLYHALNFRGEANLDSMVHPEAHRWRRQVWDRAFSTKSLARYELCTRETTKDWLSKLRSLQGQPVNISLYSLLIGFDNMGKMGYSKNFGTIQAGKENRMIDLIGSMFGNVGKLGQLTWPIMAVNDLGINKDQYEFNRLTCQVTDEREMNDGEDKDDLMKYFLEDYKSDKPKAFVNRNILYSDSQVIMIGGTDTLGASMSYCFYYLARDSTLREALREELKAYYGLTVPGEFTNNDLARVSLLDAIINESMRLHNPVCNSNPRTIGPGGTTIDGRFISAGTTVFVNADAMHRSEKYFKQPQEFIPERWTTRPELILDKRAFHPFLLGPLGCVGKRLGLIVLRLILANTTWHYDFKFAPGEDGIKIHTEATNRLILKAGPLFVNFQETEL